MCDPACGDPDDGAEYWPVALPHLEVGGDVRFLGEIVEEALFDQSADAGLWAQCDGTRARSTFDSTRASRLDQWRHAGLVLGAGPSVGIEGPAEVTVISPHPDDAALAVGGLLAALSARSTLVLDVFTHETWTQRAGYRSRPEFTAELLLAEEAVAARVLGTTATLLGYDDAVLRPAWAENYLLDESAAGYVPPGTVEPDLVQRLIDDLAARLPVSGPILVPLAVGGHTDHLLCRNSVLDLVADGRLDAARVHFYEDMPYSVFADPEVAVAALRRRGLDLSPSTRPVPPWCVAVKREALRAYRLQVTTGLATRVMRYGTRLARAATDDGAAGFAERLWASPDASAWAAHLGG